MRELLEHAGFRIRSAKRADCAHCTGRSRGTVSYTAEVAYCHRCHWTANSVTLGRQLGLKPAGATPNARRRHAELAAFEAWREARIREVAARYRRLWRAAEWARVALRLWPDWDAAWEALGRLCHQRARLEATLDFLLCIRFSQWLERDADITDVLAAWRTL
jgi:hypothetical protein